MAKLIETLTEEQIQWINSQKIFFVASAPLNKTGHVNCSPKGGDSFKLISSKEFIYADFTGSAAETIAHIMENERICVMFCSFEKDPKIIRLHGNAFAISESMKEFSEFKELFPVRLGIRAFIKVQITRIASSCGEQVPYYSYIGERSELKTWEQKLGKDGLKEYRKNKNSKSIDGISVSIFE